MRSGGAAAHLSGSSELLQKFCSVLGLGTRDRVRVAPNEAKLTHPHVYTRGANCLTFRNDVTSDTVEPSASGRRFLWTTPPFNDVCGVAASQNLSKINHVLVMRLER